MFITYIDPEGFILQIDSSISLCYSATERLTGGLHSFKLILIALIEYMSTQTNVESTH